MPMTAAGVYMWHIYWYIYWGEGVTTTTEPKVELGNTTSSVQHILLLDLLVERSGAGLRCLQDVFAERSNNCQFRWVHMSLSCKSIDNFEEDNENER